MPIRGHIGTHVIDGILLNGVDTRIHLTFSLQLIHLEVFQISNKRWKRTYQCGLEPKIGQHIGHTVGQLVKIIEYSRRFV